METEITWVGHASFLLREGSAVLWTDPWTVGRAFDESWDQYVPACITEGHLAQVTHLWVSHEHPDHFSPATLRSIPEDIRRRITVLYTSEADGRVADTCRNLGFHHVAPLRPGVWTPIGDRMEVMCSPHRLGDSYLATRTSAGVVLNLNDCAIDTDGEAASILDQIGGRPAVLLTQFSDANRAGHRHDREHRQRAARRALVAMTTQISVLEPAAVIPFASCVWFCHTENAYMNDSINKMSEAVRVISEHSASQPVVLYPGDSWRLDQPPPSAAAVAVRYDRALDRAVSHGTLTESTPVPLDELERSGETFSADLDADNGRRLLMLLRAVGYLRPVEVQLTDSGERLRLTTNGVERSPKHRPVEVFLSSSALKFFLEHRFGGSTLLANARFHRPVESFGDAFYRLIRLRDANNARRTIVYVAWMRVVPLLERRYPRHSIGRWVRDHRAGALPRLHDRARSGTG